MTILILQALLGMVVIWFQTVFQNSIKKREQATMIASLFAEWINNPKDVKNLNCLAWEATLWLPDNLAKKVNERLSNSDNAPDIREILIEVKKLIHGRISEMNYEEIVYFKAPLDAPNK